MVPSGCAVARRSVGAVGGVTLGGSGLCAGGVSGGLGSRGWAPPPPGRGAPLSPPGAPALGRGSFAPPGTSGEYFWIGRCAPEPSTTTALALSGPFTQSRPSLTNASSGPGRPVTVTGGSMRFVAESYTKRL